jgi:acyl-CoA reductase-like NAD-dependent aldehyde dehydrogenase
MKAYDKIYIGGEWVAASSSESFEVLNASTEEVIGRIPKATPADAARAAERAAAAFPAWSEASIEQRADFLQRLQGAMGARMNELAETIASEVGMPLKVAVPVQVGLPTLDVGSFAEIVRTYPYEEQVGHSLVVREPVGVVACITPWNYPLLQVVAKIAPAIGAGCTVVLKPSEVAPLSAFMLTELIDEIGLPPGVFNLVSGDGPTVGEALVTHPKIDMVSFTGSTRAGRRISELVAPSIKRLALELGGKSACLILDDADLAKAVQAGVNNCFLNSGQTCSAHTRMLVPKSKLAEAEEYAKRAAESFKLGNALAPDTLLGPLISDVQRERVLGYIRKGMEEGAKLVTGGTERPQGLDKGFFVRPTVFSNVNSRMTIAQEEIFGPVLCIMPYDDEADGIRIANDTIYGLAGGVWSADTDRAKRVARKMRTGQVDINGGAYNPNAPFGGYKQSGRGREYGKHGFEEFLEIKSLQL